MRRYKRVKGAGRKVPRYPEDDRVGNFHMTVMVNATERKIIGATGSFTASDGIGGYLDGWEESRSYYRVGGGGTGASLLIEAGPNGAKNPFSLTDFFARLTWDMWFDPDGNIGQEIIFAQEGGGGVIPIGDDVPGIDDLLVDSRLSLTVNEWRECVGCEGYDYASQ